MLLVLDDRLDICKVMRRLMRLMRLQGSCFQSWNEAKEALDSSPESYKHALIDLGLSEGRSGLDVIHWIRRNYPHIQCILTSGARGVPQVEGEYSYHRYLAKPFDVDELVSIIS